MWGRTVCRVWLPNQDAVVRVPRSAWGGRKPSWNQKTSVDHTLARIRDEIQSSAIYGISEEPEVQTAERLRSHPLPHWV